MATTYHDQLRHPTPTVADQRALAAPADVDQTLPNDAHANAARAGAGVRPVVFRRRLRHGPTCSARRHERPADRPLQAVGRAANKSPAAAGRKSLDEVSPLLLFAVPLVDAADRSRRWWPLATFVTEPRRMRSRSRGRRPTSLASMSSRPSAGPKRRRPGRRKPLQEVSVGHRRKNRAAAIDRPAQAADGRYFVAPADDVRGNHAAAPPHRTPVDLQERHRYCASCRSTGWRDVIPAKCVAIWFELVGRHGRPAHARRRRRRSQPMLITHGRLPARRRTSSPGSWNGWARAWPPSRSCSIAARPARRPGSIRTSAK